MKNWSWLRAALLAVCCTGLAVGSALAGDGQPSPWQMGFQNAATPIAQQIHNFDSFLLVIITCITLFVLSLLIWVMLRYNEKTNPMPSKTSHNTMIEVLWTIIPVMILVVIAIPSFRLLYAQYEFPKADLTIKATGQQWYWSYEYPDVGLAFDSTIVDDADLKEGQPRLLTVDNPIVVPVNKVVHVLVTASTVIHSWTVPAFGSKIDGVPGRISRTWFKAEHTGTFYGQCSELCGKDHARMPIAVRVVTDEEYAAWLEQAKKQFAVNEPAPANTGAALAKTANNAASPSVVTASAESR